ncbi:MAG: tail fiber protein [Caulobacter sp.]
MSEPFIGEIQLFAFSYAPYQWASCNGATLLIQQNSTLFALLGTAYGGNGSTNYQLPNLMNRGICNQGSGLGLTPRVIGENFGASSVSLTTDTIPAHTHSFQTYSGGSATRAAAPTAGAAISQGTTKVFLSGQTPNTTLSPNTITQTGGGQPHNNLSPLLALNWSIALYGVFPSFN